MNKQLWLSLSILLFTFTLGYFAGVSQSQSQFTMREILNDVFNRDTNRLMGSPWGGGLATAQGQLLTTEEVLNRVYDPATHSLRITP